MMTSRKRMTQSELLNHIAERTELKRSDVKQFFEDLVDLATSEVKANGEFQLPGFGKLVRAERRAREGRNPATGQVIQIPAKTTLKFRVGKAMKDSVLPKRGTRWGGKGVQEPAEDTEDTRWGDHSESQ
jgi:DNA-binding protein HU-beta